MFAEKYIYKFKTAEVIRLGNMMAMCEAIFHLHNDNGQRFLAKDIAATLTILREASGFVNANIGHTSADNAPTVYERDLYKNKIPVIIFRPDLTTVYRLTRALESIAHIYGQLTETQHMNEIEVTLRETTSGHPIKINANALWMYRSIRQVLIALRENVNWWDAANGKTL